MKIPKRNVHYLMKSFNYETSLNIGRGYFKENGKYKVTLSVPVEELNISDELYEQLQDFSHLYAIDTNKLELSGFVFTVSCAMHLQMEYEGNSRWKNGIFTRLPAVISLAEFENPEVLAWKRLIESLAKNTSNRVGLVVDSELGNLPAYNSGTVPLIENFFIPKNIKLIYASSERDLTSPLNKAMAMCDTDAKRIATIIKEKCNPELIASNIISSGFRCIYIPPVYA